MSSPSQVPLLGIHASIAGGLEQAIIQAEKIGCTAVQFFSKSNRQWKAKDLSAAEIALFKETLRTSTIRSTVIHASYLINIGSPDLLTSEKATQALQDELSRAIALDVDFVVFHPGSHKETSETDCIERIAQNINHILNNLMPEKTVLLLETTAGQGNTVGYSFEQLGEIYNRIERKKNIGICLDTCHIFAAGYNITSPQNYEQTMQKFHDIIGLDALRVIHLNDSKKELGSYVDRHEHIGKGHIGLELFRCIMNDIRLKNIPKILETPKNNLNDDIRNLEILRSLIKNS